MVGITLFLLCVIELLKDSNGNQIMNPEKACRDIPWGQVVMIGFIMVIATYMNTPETGVPAAMAKLLTPFTSLPPLVFVIVALFIA